MDCSVAPDEELYVSHVLHDHVADVVRWAHLSRSHKVVSELPTLLDDYTDRFGAMESQIICVNHGNFPCGWTFACKVSGNEASLWAEFYVRRGSLLYTLDTKRLCIGSSQSYRQLSGETDA